VEVRPATVEDAAAIAPLLAELGYPTEVPELRARLARIIAAEPTGVLLAEVDRSLAGLIAYQLIQHLERPSPTCRITALVIDARHRRRGGARALVEAVAEVARGHDYDRLEVTTQPDRADALALYLELGFEERPRRLVRWARHDGGR
jgi:GNAT superfamily N-acetyltransferase